MSAWSSLKHLAKEDASSSSEPESNDELEQITIARALLNFRHKEKVGTANSPNTPIPFPKKFSSQSPRPISPQTPRITTSRILPLICTKTARNRNTSLSVPVRPTSTGDRTVPQLRHTPPLDLWSARPVNFPAAGAAPYVPIRQYGTPCRGIAPPVTIRTAVPVFSAPPVPPPTHLHPQVMRAPALRIAPPVTIRQAVPVFAAPPLAVRKEDPLTAQKDTAVVHKDVKITKEDSPSATTTTSAISDDKSATQVEEKAITRSVEDKSQETKTVQSLEQLKL